MSDSSSARDPVEELAEEFASRYRRGERPSLSEYTDKYPHLADQIREVFPALLVIEEFGSAAGPPTGPFEPRATDMRELPEQLGDYRILRQVGKGGMGVVYEAVQESLGRHVALKILPFHRLMDSTHLERFRREARAAAQLHHTNIVPVFGVGEAEGIHYYAMQFIQGQGLDVVLEEVRRLRSRTGRAKIEGKKLAHDLSISIAHGLLTGQFAEVPASASHAFAAPEAIVTPPNPLEAASSESSGTQPRTSDTHSELASQTEAQYCRSVAHVGVQVAEALAYAHKQRILHRDIKPSNLLLDTRGAVWITDFGLAKAEGSEELTSPGDIVGTVRFMAPERFQGKADPRSDIYSVGITLYEMLTLQPAFVDSNRARLVERVSQEIPPRPRRLDPHIPRDLETIVLKAIAKEAADRYPTAEALAEDLRRFLDSEPIHARPVGQVERLWRWSKRNPMVAGLTAAVLLLLLLVAMVASIGYFQTALALNRALDAEAMAKQEAIRAHTAQLRLLHLNYVANMRLVQAAWEGQNIARLRGLLKDTADFPERGFEWYYWQGLCHNRDEHLTLVGHKGGVAAVAFSPDSRTLVTGANDGTARVWEAATGRELLCLKGHRSQVTSVAFAPQGQWLVTGSTDGTVRFWDGRSGRELRTLQGRHTVPVWAVAVTPDGKRVVTGSEDGLARVWDAADGRELFSLQGDSPLRVFGTSLVGALTAPAARGPLGAASALYPGRTGHTGRVWSVAVSSDGKRVMTGSGDGTARIWDADSGRLLLPPFPHDDEVTAVAISTNGRVLATGWGIYGVVQLWDAATGREILSPGSSAYIMRSIALTPDGKRVVSGTKVWDAASGQAIPARLWGLCVAVSPDGQRLATGSMDSTVSVWETAKLWDAGSGRQFPILQEHMSPIYSVTLTPDGQRIVTGGPEGTRLIDAGSGRVLLTLPEPAGSALSVAITPDGQRLVTGGWDGAPGLWDAVNGRQLLKLQRDTDRAESSAVGLDRLRIWSLAVTSDGQRIVAGNEDGTARVWDAVSGRELRKIHANFGRVFSVAVTPDGRRLVTSGAPAKMWDMVSGQPLLELRGLNSGARSVAITPDGQRIITGAQGKITLWDAESGRELLSAEGHNGAIISIAVTPDGQRIITGGEDGTARVWDTVSGHELLILHGHTKPIVAVAVTADGRKIITASEDGTLKIWEAASPELTALWTGHDQDGPRPPAAWRRPDADAPGFIQDWLILAPLKLKDDEGWAQALEREQISGEAGLRPRTGDRVRIVHEEFLWKGYHGDGPILDFNRFAGQLCNHSVAYAVCYVISEAERQDLLLQVSSDDQAKVYLNGQEIYKHILPRSLVALDPIGPVALHKGTNVLILKVVNQGMDWEGCARFVDAEGQPAQGLRVSLTAEP